MKTQKETTPVADAQTLVGRLLLAYGANTFPELAERMGEKVQTVKNWHYRESVQLKHLVRAAADTKRSLDWLATGAESLFGAPESRNLNVSPAEGAAPAAGANVSVVVAEEQGAAWRVAPAAESARGKLPGPSSKGRRECVTVLYCLLQAPAKSGPWCCHCFRKWPAEAWTTT